VEVAGFSPQPHEEGIIVLRKHLAILTVEEDIHALIVQKAFEEYEDVHCHIVETNRISGNLGPSWTNSDYPGLRCAVPTAEGEYLDVRALDVIWWRRTNFPQQVPFGITDPVHIDVINRDCRTAVMGLLLNEFSGSWINEPAATSLAENKLLQLKAAQLAGFRTPLTLVSQDPVQIREFCAALGNKAIIKCVKGTTQTPLLAKMVSEEHLADEDSLRLCPAIYQEYIPGDLHVRVHSFGDYVLAALIQSEAVDWRLDLTVPFEIFDLDEAVKQKSRNLLRALGLKMGVLDLRFQGTTPVFLEVNPQGQFLFTEGLSGLELTSAFAEFLYQEMKSSASQKSAVEKTKSVEELA
jgi:glutathione synthase/RimK-type ligase-like ATP-grasp enzyme